MKFQGLKPRLCQNAKNQSKFYKSSTVANIAEWGRKIWQPCRKWKRKRRIGKRNIIVEKCISILDYLLKIFSKIERFTITRTGSRRKNGKTRSVSLPVWNDNYCLTTPCSFVSPGVGITVMWQYCFWKYLLPPVFPTENNVVTYIWIY